MAKVTPIKAPASAGGDFEIAPEGVFLARCYKMVDVGTQTETGQFGTKENRKIYLYWELLQTADGEEIKMENGEPFSIFNQYKLSMHPKANLRKHLDSWRGKKFTDEEAADFDVTKLLDKFCLLQITHSTSKDGQKTYANVDGIMTTKKKVDGVNEISSFSIENPDMEVFDALPEWLQQKIENAPEWEESEEDEAEAPAAAAETTKTAKKDVKEDEIDIEDVPF
jgi:hypothetical protein